MDKNFYETVIVGGGIAGFGCAHHLSQNGYDRFLLITRDIAARTKHSQNGKANYGSLYINYTYHHCLAFVEKCDRIRFGDVVSQGRAAEGATFLRSVRHLPSLLRFLFIFAKVTRYHSRFKKRSARISQKKAFEQEPFLMHLHKKSAAELVKELKLEYWTQLYLNSLVRFSTFLDFKEVSALLFLGCAAVAVLPTYRFVLCADKLLARCEGNVKYDDVVKLERHGDGWRLATKSGSTYMANNVVLAIPISAAEELVRIEGAKNDPVSVHMTHVRGVLKENCRGGRYFVFSENQEALLRITAQDNTYILYSTGPKPDLEKIFENFSVIEIRHFSPAFYVGSNLIESDQGDNLYLAGDMNIPGLEDSYISGIYAASRILRRPQIGDIRAAR